MNKKKENKQQTKSIGLQPSKTNIYNLRVNTRPAEQQTEKYKQTR